MAKHSVTSSFFLLGSLAVIGADLPESWGSYQGQPIPAHYAFATNHLSREDFFNALGALPSLRIATNPTNLFSRETGIYQHPTERGAAWERPATVTLLDTRGRTNFQIHCGLRIHGGMSRRPEETPKHSFRLAFRKDYGAAKLRAPLFGADGPRAFDDLILRAGGSDSWLGSDGARRGHATYLRDEWMRRSMEALGHRSPRGLFVHLFLNDLYWGIYNLCERPGAQFLPAHPKSVDILKGDETESGDRVTWEKLFAPGQTYEELSPLLDVPQFMDFMLLNFYAGNADWDRSANWYAIRPRTGSGRFQFFVWDAEQILGDISIRIPDSPEDDSPLALFHKLSQNKTFRDEFTTRAGKILADGGPLSPKASAERIRALAHSLEKAMPLEAARWGSYRRDVHRFRTEPFDLYTVENHWRPEVDRLSANYFTQRRDALRSQLRERGFPIP